MRVFCPANLPNAACKPTTSHRDLSGSALDREHLFDLVRLAAVDGRLAAFVVKRVDDHFEFSVAIQIKDCSDVVYIRRNRLIRFRVNFTGYKFCLNIPVDYAPQDDNGITSTLRRRELAPQGTARRMNGPICPR